jgi:hypothetical protein
LGISINVHLDNTIVDGLSNLLLCGTRATVEDKEDGLIIFSLELLLDISLVLTKKFGVELNVTGSIDTVDVTETSSNTEEVGDLAEGSVDIPDIFGLGVKSRVVNTRVINTIFLTTSDTDFHLEETVDGGHALQVLETGLNVFFLGLFREIQHVGREQRFTVGLEVLLIGIEHTIEPRQELLGTVVRVDDDRNTISLGNCTDILFFFYENRIRYL